MAQDWGTEFEANQAAMSEAYQQQERLKNAAPALLSALKRLRDLPVNCSLQEDREAWAIANAAIAAAEGVA